jgi:RNA recognition motif-containing protein
MDVFIPRDRVSGDPRGFGFVTFHDRRDAEDAEEATNECVFPAVSPVCPLSLLLRSHRGALCLECTGWRVCPSMRRFPRKELP